MAPISQSVVSASSAYNATDVLVGGLPGGYFVTADINASDHYLYLRNVSDMATALDTEYRAYKFFPGDGATQYGAITANGDIYYKNIPGGGTATSFYKVAQSSGALSITQIGPVSAEPSASPSYIMVANDASQLVIVSTTTLAGYDATTGVRDYETDISTALGTSNLTFVSIPTTNRILVHNKDTDNLLLLDESGSTLDSMSCTLDPLLYQTAPGTDRGVLITRALTDSAFTYNYVEVTTGDAISWRWGTDKTITTSWSGWTGSNLATRVGSYGNTCVITMRDRTGTYPDRSIYWIDMATGAYTASAVSPYAANGAYAINMSGAYATVLWGLDYGTWSGWQGTPRPTILRQRQSPKRAPSRVSWKVM